MKNKNQNLSLSSSRLLSRVNNELVKQKAGIGKSIFLIRLRRALRAIMRSKDYTLDANLVLKEIDKHPETARRTLDLLCPVSDYAALKMLFNYDDLFVHIRKYVKESCSENPQNLNEMQTLVEKDLVFLRSRLEEFLGKEREKEHWDREVSWDRNVTIPIPTNFIYKKRFNKDTKQDNQSIKKPPVVILDDNNDIVKVVLRVLDAGASKNNDHHRLFTIELEPQQKEDKSKVRIILHSNSASRRIPLYTENRGKGLCIYSATQISATSSKVSRWYLHAELNQEGRNKIGLISKQIENVQSDPYLTTEEKKEKVKQLDYKMTHVKNKRQYQALTVKTKGLLLYSLIESDKSVFNEIIRNLSRYNKYDEEDFDSYYELFPDAKNQNQERKLDFPFLLDYHEFSNELNSDFAFTVLKKIAMELQSVLEITSASMLKFRVSSQFFGEVRRFLWTPDPVPGIDFVNDITFATLSQYHSLIGSYVRRRQEMLSTIDELNWNEENRNNEIRNNEIREKN